MLELVVLMLLLGGDTIKDQQQVLLLAATRFSPSISPAEPDVDVIALVWMTFKGQLAAELAIQGFERAGERYA